MIWRLFPAVIFFTRLSCSMFRVFVWSKFPAIFEDLLWSPRAWVLGTNIIFLLVVTRAITLGHIEIEKRRSDVPHCVRATLPFSVDPSSSEAKWSKRQQCLTVRLQGQNSGNLKLETPWWLEMANSWMSFLAKSLSFFYFAVASSCFSCTFLWTDPKPIVTCFHGFPTRPL